MILGRFHAESFWAYRNAMRAVPPLVVLLFTTGSVWSSESCVDIFESRHQAVVSIRMHVTESQLAAEQAALKTQFAEEAFAYERGRPSAVAPISEKKAYERLRAEIVNGWEKRMRVHQAQANRPRLVGMGVNIDPEGRVLTCNSIVSNVTEPGVITVMNCAGESFPAEVYARDSGTNVVLLKIPEEACATWVPIERDWQQPPIGTDVFSIQAAYGLRPAPFRGLIGGYDRTLSRVLFENYIQLDMPLFPGNIGAPIFHGSGVLAGIVADQFGTEAGPKLTFAISNEMLADVVPDLLEFQEKPRGILGIGVEELTVLDVYEGSPAERAGLRSGDVLILFDSQVLETRHDFLRCMDRVKPYQTVEITVKRDGGQALSFAITLDQDYKETQVTEGALEAAIPVRDATTDFPDVAPADPAGMPEGFPSLNSGDSPEILVPLPVETELARGGTEPR